MSVQTHLDPPQPEASARLVNTAALSRMTGVSCDSIARLVKSNMIPRPATGDHKGAWLFDLDDPKLAKWVEALQAAGYNRR